LVAGCEVLTIVDASGFVFGGKDLEPDLDTAVIASGSREIDARLKDKELRVRRDFEVLARLELACWLVEDAGGVLSESAVNLTDNLLLESGEFDGAGTVVTSSDLPRGLLVNKAVVDYILNGTLAKLAGSEERAIPPLLLLGEGKLAIVVVRQPKVRQETVDGGAAVLGSLRGRRQDLPGCCVTLNTPVEHTGHGGLKVDGAVLRLCDIAVNPQHVVVGRSLQIDGIIATFCADSGEEITSDTFVTVSSLGEGEDIPNLEVLRFKVSWLQVLQSGWRTYKSPASSPGTIAPGGVHRLLPPLAQVFPISELRIGLTVEELRATNIVHSTTDDVVPGAIVAAE
jgi:hypothetical protein